MLTFYATQYITSSKFRSLFAPFVVFSRIKIHFICTAPFLEKDEEENKEMRAHGSDKNLWNKHKK